MRKELLIILFLGLSTFNNESNKKIDYSYLESLIEKHPIENIETKEEIIDINKIIKIESSGEPNAYNKNSRARGLMQITPIVLDEWNYFNPDQRHTLEDLFNPEINIKIGTWYLKDRIINHYLPFYGLEPNIENIIISYNFGIGELYKMYKTGNFDSMPFETINYIKKYKEE